MDMAEAQLLRTVAYLVSQTTQRVRLVPDASEFLTSCRHLQLVRNSYVLTNQPNPFNSAFLNIVTRTSAVSKYLTLFLIKQTFLLKIVLNHLIMYFNFFNLHLISKRSK